MLSRLRGQAAAVLAATALALGVAAAVAPAAPAGVAFTQQCDTANVCGNFWGGGFAVAAYHGTTYNNWITIKSIGGGDFELLDMLHGGCIGDLGGSQYSARAGGGQDCPSSGHAAWGSVFRPAYNICGSGYAAYYNPHNRGYLGWNEANGSPAYLNTAGKCLQQRS
jgi:hypothetical protein